MASAAPKAGHPPPSRMVAPGSVQDVAMLSVGNPGVLVFGIMLASLLQILDSTIANVAIPHMQSALGATSEEVSWVLTSYIVATAITMPVTGWLADRVGSRRLFILSVAGFVLASMLCGLAQNVTQMVIFRVIQGATGAFISPLSQAAMIDTNRPSRQAQMMAIWGMGIMIGPILGPILGGWLTENWNWRWVFYVNVPLGAVALAILIGQLPSREIVRRRFDLAGFVLIGIALTATQLLLDRGNHIDWFKSGEAWIYAILALSTAWMAAIHLATTREPLFSRQLFADPNYLVALLFMLVMGVVLFATIALIPPMLQRLMGYGVIDTGLVLMPRGVGTLISMQISGILVRRGVDGRLLIAMGFLVSALSLWEMAHWSLAVDSFSIVAWGFVQGLGIGLVFIPLNSAAFATISPAMRTDGSSLLNLARSMGSSIGISVVFTLFGVSVQTVHSELAGHVTSSATAVIDFSSVDRFQSLGEAALRMADAEVNRQAAMVAYVNDFYLMAWLSLATVPLVLLMRRPPAPPGPQRTTADDQSH